VRIHSKILASILGLVFTSAAMAQTGTDTDAAASPLEDSETNTVLDDTPVGSARASGMSGSMTAVADDLDALLYNPAGIGGRMLKKGAPGLRKLYFPQLSVFANKNTRELRNDFTAQGGAASSTIGSAIVDAHAGKRQYGRVSSVLGFVLGRTIVVPFNDMQISAVSQGDGSDLVDMRYRNQSGIGYGFSVQDTSETFSLGYSGYMAQRSEIYGAFLYSEIIDQDARKQILKDSTVKSSGRAHNIGMSWKLAKTAAPTLSLVAHDVGDTRFTSKSEDQEDTVYKQNLTTGFSLATAGKSTIFTWMLEAGRLNDDEVAFDKKVRTSFEWAIGGAGSYAAFALRGGYSFAGPSAGATVNLGIIGIDAGLYSVDVGTGNEKLTEQRYTGTLFVNVAEPF
jgi:hypothetical protein